MIANNMKLVVIFPNHDHNDNYEYKNSDDYHYSKYIDYYCYYNDNL